MHSIKHVYGVSMRLIKTTSQQQYDSNQTGLYTVNETIYEKPTIIGIKSKQQWLSDIGPCNRVVNSGKISLFLYIYNEQPNS